MPLLYVDLLGMKARYRRGGPRAARSGYEVLEARVAEAVGTLAAARTVRGGVQSDAAALQFATTLDAVAVGRRLFQLVFDRSSHETRYWVRGVIVSGGDPAGSLETTRVLVPGRPGLVSRQQSASMLRAIHAEQGGFRGQRLLIEDALVSTQLTAALAIPAGQGHVFPTHQMAFSECPTGFRDVLWPMTNDPNAWPRRHRKMLDRLRRANTGGPEEALHASATHLLFAEIDSIVHGLGGP